MPSGLKISAIASCPGRFTRSWAEFFEEYDVVLTPTMPVMTFPVERMAPETLDGEPVPETFDAWCGAAAHWRRGSDARLLAAAAAVDALLRGDSPAVPKA
jgi:hypothetical protein